MQKTKFLSYGMCLWAVITAASPAQTSGTGEEARPRRVELQRALTAFASWAKRYATKTGTVTEPQALQEGIKLAKQRREAFVHLMQTDPAFALSNAIRGDLRNFLPAEIKNELEETVQGTGDLLVICAMPVAAVPSSGGVQRVLRLNGRTYKAEVYGRRLNQTTKYGIPIYGVSLDGVVALDQEVLVQVPPGEIPPGTQIKDLSGAAGPLAGSGQPVLARLGDRIYRFASADHLMHSEALLESAESDIRPELSEPETTFLEGARFPEIERQAARPLGVPPPPGVEEIKVLVIRVDFNDMPGDPSPVSGGPRYTASSVQTVADTQIASYYQNSSYGHVKMSFTVTPQLYRLPLTANYYATTGNYFELYYDALAAAGADYTVTNYGKTLVLFSWLGFIPNSQIQFGGLAVIGSSMSMANGEFDFRVVAHELGHTLGLFHGNFWQTNDQDPVSDNGASIEYGDVFDTMGANGANDPRVDFNPWFKYLLGWIHDDQVQTITQAGVYRVYRFDNTNATGTLALKLTKDFDRSYWIGFRRNFSENHGLQHGAYVEWGYPYAHQSNLLGLGATSNKPSDPGLVLGTAMADAMVNVTILPVAQGGAAPNEYLDVQVAFGPPPIITEQPSSQFALQGFAAHFSIEATGNPSYIWQRQVGGTGDWLALSEGGGYAGVSTADLQISQATLLMNGDCFRCLLTNSQGGFNCSTVAALTVNAFGVATFVGQAGIQGDIDGTGDTAQFNSPAGIAVDKAGNLYVADTGNNVIRKITPAGVVSHLAGLAGNSGSADGLGPDARFDSPMGLSLDGSGSVYVADQMNSTIRRISPEGLVTTLAGLAGSVGSNNGAAADARFNHPSGLAFDCYGNVYVADTGNNTIRVINSDGVVTTLAGLSGKSGATDGLGPEARFDNPVGIAVDATGIIYVADQGSSTIRRISPGGVVTTIAGLAGVTGSVDGLGANARFTSPRGLASDLAGNLYVADQGNSTIRQISPVGEVTTFASVATTNGIVDDYPTAVAVDNKNIVYVADTSANTIRLIRSLAPQPPLLRMSLEAGRLTLSWPAEVVGYVLETRNDLSTNGAWIAVSNQPVVVGCSLVVTNDAATSAGFFRLHRQ